MSISLTLYILLAGGLDQEIGFGIEEYVTTLPDFNVSFSL